MVSPPFLVARPCAGQFAVLNTAWEGFGRIKLEIGHRFWVLWGFKKFCQYWSLRPLPATCISSCPAPWGVCVVHLHLRAEMGTWALSRQRTKGHWNQLCLLKESPRLSPCTEEEDKVLFLLKKASYIFFKIFYINYVVYFESSLNRTRKYSQSRSWMLFPAVRETFLPQCSCSGTVARGILSMWNSLRRTVSSVEVSSYTKFHFSQNIYTFFPFVWDTWTRQRKCN